jgi:uncharacterized membrane protein YeiH
MFFVTILELIGTVAFAISGAVTATKKKMDLLGIMIMGVTTACGGGVLRDIMLGRIPPTMFKEPIYAVFGLLTSAIVFIPAKYNWNILESEKVSSIIQLADAIGLGIFTAVGINAVYNAGYGKNAFFAVALGVITGVGGGVLRDIFAGDRPYIFVKHIYACASLVGALLYIPVLYYFGVTAAILTCSISTIVIRILAAHFRWSLPKISNDKDAGTV